MTTVCSLPLCPPLSLSFSLPVNLLKVSLSIVRVSYRYQSSYNRLPSLYESFDCKCCRYLLDCRHLQRNSKLPSCPYVLSLNWSAFSHSPLLLPPTVFLIAQLYIYIGAPSSSHVLMHPVQYRDGGSRRDRGGRGGERGQRGSAVKLMATGQKTAASNNKRHKQQGKQAQTTRTSKPAHSSKQTANKDMAGYMSQLLRGSRPILSGYGLPQLLCRWQVTFGSPIVLVGRASFKVT